MPSYGKFSRYTLVLNQDPVAVVSVELKLKKATVIIIPGELQVESAHGYGQLSASKVFAAGQLDRRGGSVLQDTMADLLGLNIDAVVTPKQPIILGEKPSRTAFLNQNFLQSSGSNLLAVALFNWDWVSLRSDKIETLNFGSSDISSELILADGSTAQVVGKETLDRILGNSLFSSKIVSEDLRVGIINSTSINGLGSRAARFLANQGVNVVNVETRDSSLAGCEIQFSDKKTERAQTFLIASDYFGCKGILNAELDSRFDLLIIVGDLFAQRYVSNVD